MKKNLILIALCGATLALATGCAAPGAPLPPSLRLPAVVNNLSATRKGNRVLLTWSPATETTDHQPMRWPSTTRICRVLNQFPIEQCSQIVAQIKTSDLASLSPAARRPVVSFEDVLPTALIAPQNQFTYAIEAVNQRGRSAGLSNQVLVPLVPTAPPPPEFRATLDAQGPLLHWEMTSVPAFPPGITCRLRIYRRSTAAEPAPGLHHPAAALRRAAAKPGYVLVAEQPCRSGPGQARDESFEWEKDYEYKAVAVTVIAAPGRAAVEVEGDDSELAPLVTHDVFPPAVPSNLQAVFSSVGQKPFIDLTWAPDTEPDLAGYRVYRRTAGTPFAVVSPGTLKSPAWRDTDVQPGQTYFYTVTAIDVRGNQSAQSAPASETVPLEVR
jgi:hypothetical protein